MHFMPEYDLHKRYSFSSTESTVQVCLKQFYSEIKLQMNIIHPDLDILYFQSQPRSYVEWNSSSISLLLFLIILKNEVFR